MKYFLTLEQFLQDFPKFEPITNPEILRLFKRYHYKSQFIAKDNKLYYITFDRSGNISHVFSDEIYKDNFKKGYTNKDPKVGYAVFDVKDSTFSGYLMNDSIFIEEEFRRIGLATAITDYAEMILNKKYTPSRLLSDEMENFVINRFSNKTQTQTNENKISTSLDFKKWFSGSKIVDSNSEPMICYHRSKVKFDKFDDNFQLKMVG